jgi:hypothetical protein
MTAIKISLGGFFLRIVVEPWQRWVVIGAVVISCTLNIATVFFFIFMCGVPQGGVQFFEKYIGGQCVSSSHQLIMYYFQACSGTLTDLTFALLPIAILRRSALPLRDKITAGGILLLAALYVSLQSAARADKTTAAESPPPSESSSSSASPRPASTSTVRLHPTHPYH